MRRFMLPFLWQKLSRPFGTRCLTSTIPPLKGWAIFESPSGRRRTNCLRCLGNGGRKNLQTPSPGLRPAFPARRVRAMGLVFCFPLLNALPAQSTPLALLHQRLSNHLAQPKFSAAAWGVKIVSLDTGKVLFEHDAGKLL